MNRSIQSLARAYQDRTLSEEDVRELSGILSSDVEAREVFLCEANLIAALEDVARDEAVDVPSVGRLPLATQKQDGAAHSSRVKLTMAAGWLVAAVTALLMIVSFLSASSVEDETIATIVGVSGPLQWTGGGGQVRSDLSNGMQLPGGTIDGLSPESWFALEFIDGSTVITSGNSMLAYSDVGQKVLHLKSGNLSADITPQPPGLPMLIHTRSAVLEVIGTSFEVDADLASTALNVTEGKVRVQRLSDGQRVEVPAQHQVVAAADQDLSVKQVPQVVHTWRSRFENGARRTYGRWLPSTVDTPSLLHCIPHITEDGRTIYTSSAQVTTADAAPVMTNDRTLVQVYGRLHRQADLFVGISLRTAEGDFAGRFQVVLPEKDLDSNDEFDIALPMEDFELDPSLAEMKHWLPKSPSDLIVESIWCHTLYQQAGLAVASFELTERPE